MTLFFEGPLNLISRGLISSFERKGKKITKVLDVGSIAMRYSSLFLSAEMLFRLIIGN